VLVLEFQRDIQNCCRKVPNGPGVDLGHEREGMGPHLFFSSSSTGALRSSPKVESDVLSADHKFYFLCNKK
jgi:hypothetical protein